MTQRSGGWPTAGTSWRASPKHSSCCRTDAYRTIRHDAGLHPDITSPSVVSQRRATSMQPCDAPQHNRLRRAVAAALSQGSYAAQLDEMKRRADDLFDALLARGAGDLVADFILPVVFEVICDLLGIPERRLRRFAARGEGKAAGRRFEQRACCGQGRGSAHGCRAAPLHHTHPCVLDPICHCGCSGRRRSRPAAVRPASSRQQTLGLRSRCALLPGRQLGTPAVSRRFRRYAATAPAHAHHTPAELSWHQNRFSRRPDSPPVSVANQEVAQ
jgi:hypothetical protein